jgi:hypothetical protein
MDAANPNRLRPTPAIYRLDRDHFTVNYDRSQMAFGERNR